MPRRDVLALLGAFLMFVAPTGCAASPQNKAHSSTDGGATMPEKIPPAASDAVVRGIPLASSLPGPALPVLSAEQVEGLRALPWKEVSVQSDGRHVVVVVTASARSIKGVQIGEGQDQMVLKIYGIPPQSAYSVGSLVHTLALVELPEALAGRRLTAEPTGDCTG